MFVFTNKLWYICIKGHYFCLSKMLVMITERFFDIIKGYSIIIVAHISHLVPFYFLRFDLST